MPGSTAGTQFGGVKGLDDLVIELIYLKRL